MRAVAGLNTVTAAGSVRGGTITLIEVSHKAIRVIGSGTIRAIFPSEEVTSDGKS